MSDRKIRLYQLAFSVADRAASERWYAAVLGQVPAKYDDHHPGGAVQGLPGAQMSTTWMLDQQGLFEVEFFQYARPEMRPLPSDWRACDIGYTMVSAYVQDFDAAVAAATAEGSPALTAPRGGQGDRRVCVRDPDGVLIELHESDPRTSEPEARPRPEINGAIRSIRASVPDLSRSLRFFVETLGMTPTERQLHSEEDEVLWGLEGASRSVQTLWAGDLWLELVQYHDPRGAPRPADHRISDQGILNFALCARERDVHRATMERVHARGYHVDEEFVSDAVEAAYVMDDDGFSVELTYMHDVYIDEHYVPLGGDAGTPSSPTSSRP